MLGDSKFVIFISFPRQQLICELITIKVLVTILVILDVSGAFDAAWWPSILMALKDFYSPTNIKKLTKRYLSQSTAVMSTKTSHVEREVSKSCPQGSCFGNGVCNTQHNSLLNLEFTKQIKTTAFADESFVSVKTESIGEAENNTNLGMNIISFWAKYKKSKFNEKKSNIMFLSRKKKKEITVYMKCKPLEKLKN